MRRANNQSQADNPEVAWTLNPMQWDFVHCASRFSFYVGGLGAGKTTAGAMRAILRAVELPAARCHRRADLSDVARRHRPHLLRAAADLADRLTTTRPRAT